MHLGLQISSRADGGKGSLTADALPADLPLLGGHPMNRPTQPQARRQKTVYSHRGEQGSNETPVDNQVTAHLHSQSLQGLLTHLQSFTIMCQRARGPHTFVR